MCLLPQNGLQIIQIFRGNFRVKALKSFNAFVIFLRYCLLKKSVGDSYMYLFLLNCMFKILDNTDVGSRYLHRLVQENMSISTEELCCYKVRVVLIFLLLLFNVEKNK